MAQPKTSLAAAPPEVIYLQYHGDGEPDDEGQVRDADVTWCRDKIFKHDVKYVRSPRSSATRAPRHSGGSQSRSSEWLERARAALTEAHDIVTKAIPTELELNKKWLLRNTKKHIQDAQYSLEGAL